MVETFQEQFGLDGTLGGDEEEKSSELLNQQLKIHGPLDIGTDFVVRGTVKDASSRPQGDLVIIAFDRALRRWQEWGRAASNAKGQFEIPYRY